MALDPTPFGVLAAQFMDELEVEYGGDATLTQFALVTEVETADGSVMVDVRQKCMTGPIALEARALLLARAIQVELEGDVDA